MKSINATEKIIIGVSLVVVVAIVWYLMIQNNVSTPQTNEQSKSSSDEQSTTESMPAQLPSNEELDIAYQTAVNEVLTTYSNDSVNYEAAAQAYPQIVQQLLDLQVSPQYQSLHLQLVLGFERMANSVEGVLDNNPSAIEAFEKSRADVAALGALYPWLEL